MPVSYTHLLNGGLGWLFPFYDKKGNLAFKHFPAYEVLPFWADDDHTILDSAIRLYPQEVWDGYTKKIIERVELFKTDGLYRYIYDGSELKPDVEAGEHESYFTIEEMCIRDRLKTAVNAPSLEPALFVICTAAKAAWIYFRGKP